MLFAASVLRRRHHLSLEGERSRTIGLDMAVPGRQANRLHGTHLLLYSAAGSVVLTNTKRSETHAMPHHLRIYSANRHPSLRSVCNRFFFLCLGAARDEHDIARTAR